MFQHPDQYCAYVMCTNEQCSKTDQCCANMLCHVCQICRLDVGQLQMYGSVTWFNAPHELGRLRKGTQLVTVLFVFKVGVVILSLEKSKMSKKHKVGHGQCYRLQVS